MTTNASLTGFQLGLAAIGLSGVLSTACGPSNLSRDGGPDGARRDGGTLRDASMIQDASSGAGDAGRCSLTSLNPPAALRFRAYDVRYGGSGTTVPQTTAPFGGVFVHSDLILPVTGGSAAGDASVEAGATNTFVGLFQLGSMPFELPASDDRVRRRVNGDPLAALSRPGFPNWDEAFPGAQVIGLAYTVQGRIDPNACTLNLILMGAVNAGSGLQTNQPSVALSFYGQRTDGIYDRAAVDFGNEAVAVFRGNLNLNLSLRPVPGSAMMESAVYVVCDNNCPTIPGSSVRRLEVILTTRPQNPAPADAGTDSGPSDSAVDSGAVDSRASDAQTDAGLDAARDAATTG